MEAQLVQVEKSKKDADAKLKEQMQEYKDLEKNMKNKLEYLHNDIEKQKKAHRLEMEEANTKISDLTSKLADADSDRQKLTSENEDLKNKVDSFQKKLDDFAAFKKAIEVLLEKVLKLYQPISSNLSCLSCLEFLENPLMLI